MKAQRKFNVKRLVRSGYRPRKTIRNRFGRPDHYHLVIGRVISTLEGDNKSKKALSDFLKEVTPRYRLSGGLKYHKLTAMPEAVKRFSERIGDREGAMKILETFENKLDGPMSFYSRREFAENYSIRELRPKKACPDIHLLLHELTAVGILARSAKKQLERIEY